VAAQDPYRGIWEGDFMDQFKTAVLLDQDGTGYKGKILMYSGENRIQDDELSEIRIENRTISFYIAAKETSYQGEFDQSDTEVSGYFIFPDKSRHPLKLKKHEEESLTRDREDPSLKEQLKKSFPVEELKSDFRELVRKLKEYHPRLYSYSSEASFDEQAEEIMESLDADMNLEAYYYRIAPLVASVKCSHTGVRLPAEYQQSLHENGLYFPLDLYFRDKKAYVLSTPGIPGTELKAGDEITSINGRTAEVIFEELASLIPAEGNNMSRKYQELNRDFHSYYHMLDPALRFSVQFTSAGTGGSTELDAIPYSGGKAPEGVNMSQSPYGFYMQGIPETAVLTLSSFGIRDMEKYLAFLDSTFQSLRDSKVEHLILDLRDNQGGHPIFAAQLLSFLTGDEFTYFQANPDIKDFEPLYHPMQPAPNHFKGTLYVLVNGNCLSTTGHLISLLKYHTDALFLGEDPGSTYLCNDFSMQIRLPHTGLDLNIPRTTFITAVEGFNESQTFPLDYVVEVSVKDKLADTDAYLSLAFDLIQGS
jgi:C-terminal processing protease CtpA/Prc